MAETGGFDYKALASKKVGGIPVIWIIAVVALAALYGALRMKKTPEVEEDIPEGDSPDESGDGGDTDQPVFSATPVIMQPSGPSVASTPMADTNEMWSRRAVEWLIANGFSLALASNAITKYMEGNTLSFEEGKARDAAVKQYGLPPEGLLPTSTAGTPSPPASKQGTPPTKHTVKGANDNTTAELARVYYGIANADAINLIDSKNPTLTKPYRVGTVVNIPPFHRPVYYKATSAVRTLYAIARKNGTTPQAVQELNPGKTFPVKVGTSVRVK